MRFLKNTDFICLIVLPLLLCIFFPLQAQDTVVLDSTQFAEKATPKPLRIVYDANVVCNGTTVNMYVDYSAFGVINDPLFAWNSNLPSSINDFPFTPFTDTSIVTVDIFDGSTKIGADSVTIYNTVYPEPYNVIHDTICLGETATIGISAGKYWNWTTTNGTTQYINDRPLKNTVYPVQFSNYPIKEDGFINNCFLVDSAIATVIESPTFSIHGDSTVCFQMDANINIINGTQIEWSIGGNSDNITLYALESDSIVYITATDPFGCRGIKRWKVSIVDSPNGEIISSSDSVCLGHPISLTMRTSSNTKIRWFSGSSDTSIIITPKQTIIVYCDLSIGTNDICTGREYKTIFVEDCSTFFFPSGFKINGLTKEYKPIGVMDSLRTYYFAIFTRNGKKIFETTDLSLGWDGKYKGSDVNPDVYIYYYQETYDRFTTKKNGTITVIK